MIELGKETKKISDNHYKVSGTLTFSKNVNVFDYLDWKIIIPSLDSTKYKAVISYPNDRGMLSKVKD